MKYIIRNYVTCFVKNKLVEILKTEFKNIEKKILFYTGSFSHIILRFFHALAYPRQDEFNNTVLNIDLR